MTIAASDASADFKCAYQIDYYEWECVFAQDVAVLKWQVGSESVGGETRFCATNDTGHSGTTTECPAVTARSYLCSGR